MHLPHVRWAPSRIDAPALSVQIYDIETRYLTDANPRGNAVRGEHAYSTPPLPCYASVLNDKSLE